jgi:hypothetical protein
MGVNSEAVRVNCEKMSVNSEKWVVTARGERQHREVSICIFRLTQHTSEYIILNSGYMFRLTGSHHQAFQEHKA